MDIIEAVKDKNTPGKFAEAILNLSCVQSQTGITNNVSQVNKTFNLTRVWFETYFGHYYLNKASSGLDIDDTQDGCSNYLVGCFYFVILGQVRKLCKLCLCRSKTSVIVALNIFFWVAWLKRF